MIMNLCTNRILITQGSWNDESFDIDIPISGLQSCATKFQNGPRLSYEQWHALLDDAKKIWDIMSQGAKIIILCFFQPTSLPIPPIVAIESLLLGSKMHHHLVKLELSMNLNILHHVFMNFMGKTHHLKLNLIQPLNPLMVSL